MPESVATKSQDNHNGGTEDAPADSAIRCIGPWDQTHTLTPIEFGFVRGLVNVRNIARRRDNYRVSVYVESSF